MKVAIFARTPLAAAPWELFKALRRYTDVNVELINGKARYNDGRSFPYHLLFTQDNGAAVRALRESEVWHVHNYLVPQLAELRDGQRVIAQFHSLPRLGNWQALMAFADRCYTIKQPGQEREYSPLKGLPNIIDPDEYYPCRRDKKITIAFAPSSRAPVGHPASKGYLEVREVLQRIARKRDIYIAWIERKPYEENLRLKSEAHILIDDVVTGNWHRTSLEGACFGCVVMNKIRKVPFVYASLATLERRLLWLIDNPAVMADYQERTRLWVLRNWHAMDKIQHYVQAYKEVAR